MKVHVSLVEWRFKVSEGVKKIVGTYSVKSGAMEIANQSFNDGYSATTLIFSTQLMLDIEELTKRIEEDLIKNFTGEG